MSVGEVLGDGWGDLMGVEEGLELKSVGFASLGDLVNTSYCIYIALIIIFPKILKLLP